MPGPRQTSEADRPQTAPDAVNVVTLRGRVTTAPTDRTLPSGTAIVSVRLSLPRGRTAMTAGSKARSDWVDCVGWTGRVRRAMRSWQVGDTVEVSGALRRRFFRTTSGPTSLVEVEALSVTRVRRDADRA